MKSFGERWDDIRKDPVKLKRLFTAVWVTAYSMLILGFFLIVWVLLTAR
ncbi:MAG: hypothetical protein KRP56_00385 [Candidatus Methanogranum gryphiswaldense]|nr:MAG: hypothetical protein KRP56_00385 [Candidatus Methanogranum sp. U3.2.1]